MHMFDKINDMNDDSTMMGTGTWHGRLVEGVDNNNTVTVRARPANKPTIPEDMVDPRQVRVISAVISTTFQ